MLQVDNWNILQDWFPALQLPQGALSRRVRLHEVHSKVRYHQNCIWICIRTHICIRIWNFLFVSWWVRIHEEHLKTRYEICICIFICRFQVHFKVKIQVLHYHLLCQNFLYILICKIRFDILWNDVQAPWLPEWDSEPEVQVRQRLQDLKITKTYDSNIKARYTKIACYSNEVQVRQRLQDLKKN